jgi:hypothetical protein
MVAGSDVLQFFYDSVQNGGLGSGGNGDGTDGDGAE